MQDAFGRSFAYLRLSVTEVCNFRCSYCLPDGYEKPQGTGAGNSNGFLRLDEIRRLGQAFAALGLWKVRITGGEPTLRKDFTQIVQTLAQVDGIRRIATTTNGYKLAANAQKWRDAGLHAVNISVDSLQPDIFHKLTGHNRLDEVLAGIEACLAAGFSAIKVNAVLLKGINEQELARFLQFVRTKPISVRFIELMRTGDNEAYFNKFHVPASTIAEQLLSAGWVQKTREAGAGPAQEYVHGKYSGKIGLIAPYSKDFCNTCNRLRVSSRGDLHLCLFSEDGISLRDFLQSDEHIPALQSYVMQKLSSKKATHFLHDGLSGGTRRLADIGG